MSDSSPWQFMFQKAVELSVMDHGGDAEHSWKSNGWVGSGLSSGSYDALFLTSGYQFE